MERVSAVLELLFAGAESQEIASHLVVLNGPERSSCFTAALEHCSPKLSTCICNWLQHSALCWHTPVSLRFSSSFHSQILAHGVFTDTWIRREKTTEADVIHKRKFSFFDS